MTDVYEEPDMANYAIVSNQHAHVQKIEYLCVSLLEPNGNPQPSCFPSFPLRLTGRFTAKVLASTPRL